MSLGVIGIQRHTADHTLATEQGKGSLSPLIARHANLLLAAADNVAGNARVYFIASAGLWLGLTLLLSGVAISEGLKAQAQEAVRSGADVFCTWDMFGRDAPVPRQAIASLEKLDGLRSVVPRIIGRVRLAGEFAIVVGVPLESLAGQPIALQGTLPRSNAEVLVGQELARAAGLTKGRRIPLDGGAVRVFTISGIVDSTSSLWSANAIVCDLEEAAILFGQSGHVSDVCLYTRPGYEDLIAEAIGRIPETRFRVQTKSLVSNYVMQGMTLREGVFTVLMALALALAIPTFAVLTYLGSTPRRKQIGLLKAEGWRTGHVLEMVALENGIVSVVSAAVAVLTSLVWVRVLRAPLIASFFIAELPLWPNMHIPAQFAPLAPVLALLFSLVVTMTGSIYSTWRTAITKPAEVIK